MSVLKSKVKVALVQFASGMPEKVVNFQNCQKFVARAMQEQPDTELVVLPECFNSTYATSEFRKNAEVIQDASPSVKFLSDLARKHQITLVGGTIPELDPVNDGVYNTCLIFDKTGKLIARHRKMHLFDVNIPGGITFQESETLKGGNRCTTVDTPHGKLGIGICYDMRFPELAAVSGRRGAFAMVYPSAFNTTTGPLHWHLLARARSVDNELYTLLCSPARVPGSGYQAYGHSLISDPQGNIIAEAGEGEEIIYAELDPEKIQQMRRMIPVVNQVRFDVYHDVSTDAK
ncbi:LANO_0D09296g1_1 [Lachancea nothofagi CBS 11611]|uniref:LANO_0D09296g1_1 n=1 Tax=Lachancea nothofagi CBS 11611 TaxID=1266666 RepID=A0A1G4JJB1_9SACH|nr:LANO_0D09296g1_1 [Lachancea nothofagi CBS 11611]